MTNWKQTPQQFLCISLTSKIHKIKPSNLNLMVQNESMITPGDQTALAAPWETAQGIQWSSSKSHVQGKKTKNKHKTNKTKKPHQTGTREYSGFTVAGPNSEKEWADLSSFSQSQNPMPTVRGGTGGFWLF